MTSEMPMRRNQVPNCPICEGETTILDHVRTIHSGADEEVELCACAACGHWWHSPIPDQATLLSLYESASPYVVGSGAKESYEGPKTEHGFHRFIWKKLTHTPNCGRYLEIGTGGGHLLRRFRNKGYECYGVDPGHWVPDEAIYSNLEALPPELTFGVIVLQDVLEHVVDPLALLKRLRSVAAENALIFASFPYCESRPARRYKGRWNMVRPYGHLHYFSAKSASAVFSATDWQTREMTPARYIPLTRIVLRLHLREVAYEILKGGRDQIYLTASAITLERQKGKRLSHVRGKPEKVERI